MSTVAKKRCSRCKATKPEEEFYGGGHSWCKDCTKESSRDSWERNRIRRQAKRDAQPLEMVFADRTGTLHVRHQEYGPITHCGLRTTKAAPVFDYADEVFCSECLRVWRREREFKGGMR